MFVGRVPEITQAYFAFVTDLVQLHNCKRGRRLDWRETAAICVNAQPV